eukprot:Skav209611  [mRNA]  locus=scaffold1634:367109:368122:- [translate_table: standard]
MKKPAAKSAAKSAAKKVKKPEKTVDPAWLKLVPTGEKLHLPGRVKWNNDHPGLNHAGDIGNSCGASGADDFVNLDALLEFGTFEIPRVTKGGRKTTKTRLLPRQGGRFVSGNPGKEIHFQCASVKLMPLNAALARLSKFMAVTPDNLDPRCRYNGENYLGLVLPEVYDECRKYRAVGEEIEDQIFDYIESKEDKDKERGKARSHYQAVVVEACNEKRNGHIWGEENPKAAMDQLKKKLKKAKNEERQKIESQIGDLKRRWGCSDPNDFDSGHDSTDSVYDRNDDRPHNDSRFERHDAMIIVIAKGAGYKSCARVALSKRVFRSLFIIHPFTGKMYEL